MSNPDVTHKAYIGDSVYVERCQGMTRLSTDNGFGDSNIIYLEPEVLNALVEWAERLGLIKH